MDAKADTFIEQLVARLEAAQKRRDIAFRLTQPPPPEFDDDWVSGVRVPCRPRSPRFSGSAVLDLPSDGDR